jgi:hypothetical protein
VHTRTNPHHQVTGVGVHLRHAAGPSLATARRGNASGAPGAGRVTAKDLSDQYLPKRLLATQHPRCPRSGQKNPHAEECHLRLDWVPKGPELEFPFWTSCSCASYASPAIATTKFISAARSRLPRARFCHRTGLACCYVINCSDTDPTLLPWPQILQPQSEYYPLSTGSA